MFIETSCKFFFKIRARKSVEQVKKLELLYSSLCALFARVPNVCAHDSEGSQGQSVAIRDTN